MGVDALVPRMRDICGAGNVVEDPLELRTYECDGLAHYKVTPALVVLPRTTGQLADVVRACVDHGVPYVARGSGTGLSGGALPHAEGVLVVTSQMRDLVDVDPDDQRGRHLVVRQAVALVGAQPGVVGDDGVCSELAAQPGCDPVDGGAACRGHLVTASARTPGW